MSDTTSPARLEQLAKEFVVSGVDYYKRQFNLIGERPGFRATFNPFAGALGPVWFGARGLWNWFLPFVLAETLGIIQISRGLFQDLGARGNQRAESIMKTLDMREAQLENAIAAGSDNVDALRRAVESLERAVQDAVQGARLAEGSSIILLALGVSLVLLARAIQGILANWALERRFTAWRSNRNLAHGLSPGRAIVATVLFVLVCSLSAIKFTFPEAWPVLENFPAEKVYRISTGDMIKAWFDYATVVGEGVFDAITLGVKSLLDGLETVFVGTPWPVVITFVALLAWRSAGPRVAIFTVAALAYLGLMGFWEKAMTTVSLLGAAACISITFGIPLGIVCARRPRVFAIVRPILDFMQTMPSFVYLIPVIAFFGTGKPAAILATIVFGSPPVIRLTVLGLQGVPAAIREAAISFGASPTYLLFRVDLPLAAKTIMAGVNQTIMMSLAMVVIASLIGAKGLGEDVLEALQYASEGQGILAGFAILFCAIILDRIVQGARN